MRISYAVVLAAALLGGCSLFKPLVTVTPAAAPTYRPDEVAQLKPGVTTMADTEALFGKPQRMDMHAGETTVGYSHIAPRGNAPGEGARKVEMLAIKFGADGKLVSYTLNTTVDDKR